MLINLLRWIGLGLAGLLLMAWPAYRGAMQRAFGRVRGKTALIESDYGQIEYSEAGSGIPVLVIHGSGGGYDQGELIAEVLLGDGFRAVSPSRFGYLRSTFRPGSTFDDQAHAYAALLDHLGIQRAAVIAISHGGPSALLLAVLHPERVSSLTLISAGVVSAAVENQAQANRMGSILTTVYKYNWLYWGMTTLFKKQFMGLMGANAAVIAGLTPDQRGLVERVITEMNPVSLRSAGVAFDNQAALPGERIAAVRAPSLVIHASDDTLQVYNNAAFAASTIPGAKLLRFDTGGHLLFAIQRDAVRTAVQDHIRENGPNPAER